MKITVCDICGTQRGVESCSYVYDRRMDAAGSMDDEFETYDLCDTCRFFRY